MGTQNIYIEHLVDTQEKKWVVTSDSEVLIDMQINNTFDNHDRALNYAKAFIAHAKLHGAINPTIYRRIKA